MHGCDVLLVRPFGKVRAHSGFETSFCVSLTCNCALIKPIIATGRAAKVFLLSACTDIKQSGGYHLSKNKLRGKLGTNPWPVDHESTMLAARPSI